MLNPSLSSPIKILISFRSVNSSSVRPSQTRTFAFQRRWFPKGYGSLRSSVARVSADIDTMSLTSRDTSNSYS